MRSRSSGKTSDLSKDARPRLNAEWHRQHKMPANPSLEQRATWHVSHAKACGCRPIPASVAAYLKQR